MLRMIVRLSVAGAVAVALQGCAILGGGSSTVADTAPKPEARTVYAASGGPVGLVRCKKARIGDQTCWRRGDVHTLYPAEEPGGVDTTQVVYDTPVPASARRR